MTWWPGARRTVLCWVVLGSRSQWRSVLDAREREQLSSSAPWLRTSPQHSVRALPGPPKGALQPQRREPGAGGSGLRYAGPWGIQSFVSLCPRIQNGRADGVPEAPRGRPSLSLRSSVSWSVTETCLGQQTLSSCSPRGRVPFPPSRAALLSSGTLRARLLVHGHGAERGQRPFFGRTALRSVTTHAPERDARAVLVVSRPQPRRTGRAGGVCRVTRPPLSHWVLFLVRCSGY